MLLSSRMSAFVDTCHVHRSNNVIWARNEIFIPGHQTIIRLTLRLSHIWPKRSYTWNETIDNDTMTRLPGNQKTLLWLVMKRCYLDHSRWRNNSHLAKLNCLYRWNLMKTSTYPAPFLHESAKPFHKRSNLKPAFYNVQNGALHSGTYTTRRLNTRLRFDPITSLIWFFFFKLLSDRGVQAAAVVLQKYPSFVIRQVSEAHSVLFCWKLRLWNHGILTPSRHKLRSHHEKPYSFRNNW